MRNYTSEIIGQALQNALAGLGSSWGGKIKRDQEQEHQSQLMRAIQNAKTNDPYVQVGQPPQGNKYSPLQGGLAGMLTAGAPTNMGVSGGPQAIPSFDPRNAELLAQLDPQHLAALQSTQQRGHIFGNTPAGTSEVNVDQFGKPVGPVKELVGPHDRTSMGSSDWQNDSTPDGQPIYVKIPGTNTTRIQEFKWQLNPICGKPEKITKF